MSPLAIIVGLGCIVFGLGFILCLIVLLYFFWYLILGFSSLKWNSTEGTVEDAGVFFSPPSEGRMSPSVQVRYSYVVDGEKFTSKVRGFHLSPHGDRAFLNGTRAGSKVTVYYDPRKPARATLETGTSPMNYVALFCTLVPTVGFGAVLWHNVPELLLGKL